MTSDKPRPLYERLRAIAVTARTGRQKIYDVARAAHAKVNEDFAGKDAQQLAGLRRMLGEK